MKLLKAGPNSTLNKDIFCPNYGERHRI